jgi:glycine cleavage system H protein
MKYFTRDHEWAVVEGDTATIGISYHAQKCLGDVVYLELPEPGKEVVQGKIFGVVESVKAVSDLFAPLSGIVIQSNHDLVNNPEPVNQDPEGAAWMIKVRPTNPAEVNSLLSPEDYQRYLKEEAK